MRLLTYNIHKGIGGHDRRYRLERILTVIAHEAPDLACLQEVDFHVRRSRFDDQPRKLAEGLGLEHRLFQLNVPRKLGGYGNLILSRWPFASSAEIPLKMGRRKARAAQLAEVETPEGRFHLINWHLGLAERERHWQVNTLLDDPRFHALAGLPTLIAGDYNDWRQTLGRRRGPFVRHGFHQVTVPYWRFLTFPAGIAIGALDKIYTRGPIAIGRARVVHTRLARQASDHRPVVVDFSLGSS